MKTKEFYDLAHADAYLRGTVIMYDGEPVWVNELSHAERTRPSPHEAHVYWIETMAKSKWINLGDELLDFTPIPLGNLSTLSNPGMQAMWLARNPARKWKVGLHATNLGCFNIERAVRAALDREQVLRSKWLSDTVKRKYPSYKDATKRALQGYITPFSYRFSAFKDNLYYKSMGFPVGKAEKQPELGDKFQFLAEALQEDLNG